MDAVNNCGMCGTPISAQNSIYDLELEKIYCHKCFPFIRTCHNCKDGNVCDFQTNPSPLPKQVQSTRRMGNMVTTSTISNPDRVKITCENGCPCYSAELGCAKEFCINNGFCPNDKWTVK